MFASRKEYRNDDSNEAPEYREAQHRKEGGSHFEALNTGITF